MTERQNIWQAGLLMAVATALSLTACVGGCGGRPAAPTTKPTAPATPNSATAANGGQPDVPRRHLVRDARPADLEYELVFVGRAPNGFPDVVTRLRNRTPEELIVAYGPLSVIAHADSYHRLGRDRAFPVRRILLAPGESLTLDPPAGNWVQMSPAREVELMVPTQLPPGQYRVWATFVLRRAAADERDAEVVDTKRVVYDAH